MRSPKNPLTATTTLSPGSTILQNADSMAAVPVAPQETEASLADRVLAEEHRIYPLALRWIAEGRVRLAGEKVSIDGAQASDDSLINPNL